MKNGNWSNDCLLLLSVISWPAIVAADSQRWKPPGNWVCAAHASTNSTANICAFVVEARPKFGPWVFPAASIVPQWTAPVAALLTKLLSAKPPCAYSAVACELHRRLHFQTDRASIRRWPIENHLAPDTRYKAPPKPVKRWQARDYGDDGKVCPAPRRKRSSVVHRRPPPPSRR